jgi:hypothetical protein
MKLRCPSCGGRVGGGDVDFARDRAVCRACGELFALPAADAVAREPSPAPTRELTLRDDPRVLAPAERDLYRPADFRIVEEHDALGYRATLRRPPLHAFAQLAFALVWILFLLFWWRSFSGTPRAVGLVAYLPLLHAAVGAYVLHAGLCAAINVVELRVARGRLSVRRGPIPEAREIVVWVDEIEGARAIQGKVTNRHRRAALWDVQLELRGLTSQRVPLALDGSDQAEYLAQRLVRAVSAAKAEKRSRALARAEAGYRDPH